MERTMSVEEKIRRAEEIYERRRQGTVKQVATVNVNDKKDAKLLKKMVIQLLICIAIYFCVYIIQNNNYIFSEDFINKVNEILSYDTNFKEIYENIKNNILNINNNSDSKNGIGGAQEESQSKNTQENSEESVDNVQSTANTEELSQTDKDINDVKNTTSFVKPVEGVISSKYGQRDTATGTVPKNHTGTDIAASTGTKIISATDGEVVLKSEEGDYRKTLKNSNRRS